MKYEIVVPYETRGKETSLLIQLKKQLTPKMIKDVVLPFLAGTSSISLRLLDWTVVNWTKNKSIFCVGDSGHVINIGDGYRHSLAFWKRRLFDPFRRRKRVALKVGDAEYMTTLAQLNFLMWMAKTRIFDYVLRNSDAITKDMQVASKNHKLKKGPQREKIVSNVSEPLCTACAKRETVALRGMAIG